MHCNGKSDENCEKVKVTIKLESQISVSINTVSGEDWLVDQTPFCWVIQIHAKAQQNGKSCFLTKGKKDAHLFKMQEVIHPGRKTEEAHDNSQRGKALRLWSMPEVIWSSSTSENAYANSQWSEDPHLLWV